MSILINGMEMPKDGEHPIWIALHSDGTVEYNVNKGDGWQMTTAVPVPPHGDLIDRNTLSKRIKEETINQAEFYADRRHPVVLAYGDCYSKVQNAPTIIPADHIGGVNEMVADKEGE